MLNTSQLASSIVGVMNNIETLCKTYNPNTHSLPSFQANVRLQAAQQLAAAHTAHVRTGEVSGFAVLPGPPPLQLPLENTSII